MHKLTLLLLVLMCALGCAAWAADVSAPSHQETKINSKDGSELILIPAGEFLMGSLDIDSQVVSNEKPQHKVYLDAYYIYKNDVTVAQYRVFCRVKRRKMPGLPDWAKDDHPMICVTWDDAIAYAQWAGAVLPTEAQWEKAARGQDGRLYPWGNAWDASKCQCSKVQWGDAGKTSPVGTFPSGASPYGVLDMVGNVEQWCMDWYDGDYYTHSPSNNPTGPNTGTKRVLRGGSWCVNYAGFFRAADRGEEYPSHRGANDGFRCIVRSPGP